MTPRATYRLQFHAGFRFTDATALVPYLHTLGISHVYASPYLKARPGSTHGYDIVDHNAFNPEIGTPEEYAEFVDALRAHDMGHVLDFVPNHMGVGGCDNAWWLDLLTWGRDSHYADYFDVDWEPLREQLRGKILLPFLGQQYGEVLEAGELRWEYVDGRISLRYYEHCFPLAPPTYALVLSGAEPASLQSFGPLFAALEGVPNRGERRTAATSLRRLLAETEGEHARALIERLDAERASAEGKALIESVVEAQHWRPASWKVAAEEINYRRFFDINGLAALRMEHAATFADAHKLVFELIERGAVDGLRLDHVDGLFDPLGYCDLLRSRAELLGEPLYLVIEKILAPHETLRERWNVDGTTGYEFMNAVTGIAVDGRNERAFDRLYRRLTGDAAPFEEAAYEAKRFVLMTALAAERNVLALQFDRIAQRDPRTRDFTLFELTRALVNTIAAFPVYRTYLRGDGVDSEDRRHIEWAIGRARSRDLASEGSVYAFLRRALLTETDDDALRERYVEFAMRFQQLTSPVAAKGVEDTAFYRSVRLVALNEVGGDPGRFGTPVAEFHRQNAARAATRPSAMVTTSTHDAKRGEDVRARLAVISEMPEAWRRAVGRWSRLNARHAVKLPGGRSPTPLAEYLLYQTLVGAWPAELLARHPDPQALAAFADRIAEYMVKAGREAKLRTSWANADEAYEQALERFVRRVLDPRSARAFLEGLRDFTRGLASAALANSLAQVVLRTTAPGVADTYQGSELWELSLVDPDNRRPVDFAARAATLAELDTALAGGVPRERLAAELLADWYDGRIKFYVLATLLRHRAQAAWPADTYAALEAAGTHAAHVVAYTRGNAIVVVPRLSHVLAGEALPVGAVWETTVLHLPPGAPGRYRDVLSGRELLAVHHEDALALPLAQTLGVLPVAVLEPI
ncbi:MAG: treY [Candidatus Eremiobacteraeota bacterium]|nr:treY [Candidatus Eremiobacteraeota bacterium]